MSMIPPGEGRPCCTEHARATFEAAEAVTNADPTSTQSWARLIRAEVEYCATLQGEHVFTQRLYIAQMSSASPGTVDAIRNALQRGQELRDRTRSAGDIPQRCEAAASD